MTLIYDPRKPVDYVLARDRDAKPEEQARFQLRSLTEPEHSEMLRNAMAKDVNETAVNRFALEHGLVGWNNLKDQDGNDLVALCDQGGKFKSENINILPASIRMELVREIVRMSDLGVADRKNLQPPASSTPA